MHAIGEQQSKRTQSRGAAADRGGRDRERKQQLASGDRAAAGAIGEQQLEEQQ